MGEALGLSGSSLGKAICCLLISTPLQSGAVMVPGTSKVLIREGK